MKHAELSGYLLSPASNVTGLCRDDEAGQTRARIILCVPSWQISNSGRDIPVLGSCIAGKYM